METILDQEYEDQPRFGENDLLVKSPDAGTPSLLDRSLRCGMGRERGFAILMNSCESRCRFGQGPPLNGQSKMDTSFHETISIKRNVTASVTKNPEKG
jgi:hypothetical protein